MSHDTNQSVAGNNPSTQPALLAFVPGPVLSISTGAPGFRVGECIFIRIPILLQIDGCLDADRDTDESPAHYQGKNTLDSYARLIMLPLVDGTSKSFTLFLYPFSGEPWKDTIN